MMRTSLLVGMADSLEVVAHDWPRRISTRDYFESCSRKSRNVTGARCARRQRSVEWIGLERGCLHSFCDLHRLGNQRLGYTSTSVANTHIEARERPDR